MFKLMWAILKDERGGLPLAAAVLGGSTLLGSLLGKNKKEEDVYDPYAGLRGDWQSWLTSKLGTSTPYKQNSAFDIQQPAVEKAAESTILGKLGNLPQAADYKAKVEASKTQQIANERIRAGEQKTEESDMYNRLGLVSSTPWMARAGELGEESLGRQKDIETGMDIYGLEYGLNADKTMSDIGAQWAGLGTALGQNQVGQQQYSQGMSMQDLIRQVEEEMGYGNQAAGILGANPPERTVSYTPNLWSNLASTGQNIGQMMLLQSILGGGGTAAKVPKTGANGITYLG